MPLRWSEGKHAQQCSFQWSLHAAWHKTHQMGTRDLTQVQLHDATGFAAFTKSKRSVEKGISPH